MATFTVINTDDSGLGSLRQAIEDANSTTGLDTIEFDEELSGQEITLTSGQLQITDDLTISGLGAEQLTVSGNNQSRVFLVDDGNSSNQIEVVIDGLTIRDGNTGDGSFPEINGGGFFNQENLTISNVAIVSNRAGNGPAIYSTGQFKLQNSLVSENDDGTGPIFNDGGLASISNTTISDHAVAGIGAIVNTGGGELRLANSTITNNDSFDAAVFNGEDSTAIVSNTIIAGNTGDIIPERDDVIGTFISNGYNLIGNGNGSNGFDSLGDQVGTNENPIDPLLSPLQDNGGSTQTYALLAGSPAIDAGNPDFEPPPEFDQRGAGFPRVGDGDGDGTATVDIGAFELKNIIEGTPGRDLLVGTPSSERINGLAGNDKLIGRAGDDLLDGGAGKDFLIAGRGNDTIDGGTGRDFLIAGRGDDQFVLREGDGLDTIFDYRDGTDSFLLADGLVFEDLTIAQSVGQTVISVTETSEELAALLGVDANDIGAEDFSTLV